MIDEALQEQASLHALGLLRDEELTVFEVRCAADPELQALVDSLRQTAHGLAHALPPVSPPPSLRDSILRDAARMLDEDAPDPGKVLPFSSPVPRRSGMKMAVAALALLVPAGLAVHFAMKAVDERTARTTAEKSAAALTREREELTTEKVNLTKSRDNANASFKVAQQTIEELRVLNTKLTNDYAALTGLKKQLDGEIEVLKQRQLFDEAQIALLTPTPKAAKSALAVSIWKQKQQEGVFVVRNLPELKPERNYQLWVIDKKNAEHPVSAGVLTLDGKGGGRIEFKTRKPIDEPAAFAVSNETKGEHDAPDMGNLVLLGNSPAPAP